MAKQNWKPGTMVYPLPALMVSCGSSENDYNIITISWTGTNQFMEIKNLARLT
jgi:hypothetical protein